MTKNQDWFLYMLECADGTLYFGITIDLKRRLSEHNGEDINIKSNGKKTKGKGAKYTRARRPVRIVYSETLNNRKEASSRESELKKLNRKKRLKLYN